MHMTKEQFEALLEYIDDRIEAQTSVVGGSRDRLEALLVRGPARYQLQVRTPPSDKWDEWMPIYEAINKFGSSWEQIGAYREGSRVDDKEASTFDTEAEALSLMNEEPFREFLETCDREWRVVAVET